MDKGKTKSKRKNKNYTMAGTVLIVVLVLIALFFIISLIGLINEPVGFSILLQNKEIPKGAEGILIYKVDNYGLNTIKNVTVTTKILDTFEKEEKLNFGEMSFLNSTSGSYIIKTNNLQRGQYTIKSELKYITSLGKEEIKSLTLSFKII